MTEHRRLTDREVTGIAANEDGQRKDREPARETDGDIIPGVRASDIEPYTGLRYLSKLFRVMAVIIVLLLVAEVVTGLSTIGSAAIPTLLGEASRLLVLAGLLWGSGDAVHHRPLDPRGGGASHAPPPFRHRARGRRPRVPRLAAVSPLRSRRP